MEYKVNNLFYAAGSELINTLRMCIHLTEQIDAAALEDAVGKAALRFPYFSVKLVKHGSEYRMEMNDLPFVVSPNGRTVTLGTRESNYHLFAFAYDGCRLYVDTSHFVTDGNGIFPFLKTVLYYYLSAIHPEEDFDADAIALAGSEIPDDEADDCPYPDETLPEFPVGNISWPDREFSLDDQPQGYQHMKEWTAVVLRIKQKSFMAYASSKDGSPATFISSLMYRSVADCHPDNRLPQVCGMQHQFRGALNKPQSHLCHVNIVPIIYPDGLQEKDFGWLNTVGRGQLIIKASDENDVLTVNKHIRNEKKIRDMSLSEKHDYMKQVVLDGIGSNTFEVSYTGRVYWGGLDKYITNVSPLLDMTLSGGVSIEIFSLNDIFSITIMQRNGDMRYADRFAELLKENDIDYMAENPVHFRICGFRFPD